MARVTKSVTAKARHKKTLSAAKGYYGARSRLYKTAKQSNIEYIDVYFSHDYGEACEYSDNAIWELCQYKDLIYVYLKKEYIEQMLFG